MSTSSNLVLIETLQSKQVTDLAAIQTNASDILVSQSDIANNASAIAVNASDILVSQSDISDNASAITVNAGNISSNLVTLAAGDLTAEEAETLRSVTNMKRATRTQTHLKP